MSAATKRKKLTVWRQFYVKENKEYAELPGAAKPSKLNTFIHRLPI